MTIESVLIGLLVAFGYLTGINGIQIKPFLPKPAVHHAAAPQYSCPSHIARALRAGSHLNPAVFCTTKK